MQSSTVLPLLRAAEVPETNDLDLYIKRRDSA
jgi:hypothetical protein